MTITIREFCFSLLLGARSLDQSLPHLKQEEFLWDMWCFDDRGAHYVKTSERIRVVLQ
jgi:hypothetical protein